MFLAEHSTLGTSGGTGVAKFSATISDGRIMEKQVGETLLKAGFVINYCPLLPSIFLLKIT
jgi:hypothetical protein